MPWADQQLFHAMGQELNGDRRQHPKFLVGDAVTAIGYTASGSCIDWLYAKKRILPWVVEVQPPCGNRWCPTRPATFAQARPYGQLGVDYVRLLLVRRYHDQDHHFPLLKGNYSFTTRTATRATPEEGDLLLSDLYYIITRTNLRTCYWLWPYCFVCSSASS